MNLISISAFEDNYIWVLVDDERRCVIVDPGESAPVLRAIEENGWQPEAILLTHHHNDHTGGVPELRTHFPHVVVYGPSEAQDKGCHASSRRRRKNPHTRVGVFRICHTGSHFGTSVFLQ